MRDATCTPWRLACFAQASQPPASCPRTASRRCAGQRRALSMRRSSRFSGRIQPANRTTSSSAPAPQSRRQRVRSASAGRRHDLNQRRVVGGDAEQREAPRRPAGCKRQSHAERAWPAEGGPHRTGLAARTCRAANRQRAGPTLCADVDGRQVQRARRSDSLKVQDGARRHGFAQMRQRTSDEAPCDESRASPAALDGARPPRARADLDTLQRLEGLVFMAGVQDDAAAHCVAAAAPSGRHAGRLRRSRSARTGGFPAGRTGSSRRVKQLTRRRPPMLDGCCWRTLAVCRKLVRSMWKFVIVRVAGLAGSACIGGRASRRQSG